MIVYLDICALKRPFDDARSERIRREAEAVARIFEQVENGSIQLVVSPAHRFENSRNPREDRRLATDLWLRKAERSVDSTPDERRDDMRVGWCCRTNSHSIRRMSHEQVVFDVRVPDPVGRME